MARIGVIGTGWGARVQVPVWRAAGLDVVSIAGRDRERTRRAASDLDLQPFDDWRALLRSDVDLVSIVTPPSEHLEMATMALVAGKHVVSEKPTALDAQQAAQMAAIARDHPDRIAIIDHELRFLPSFREARARIGEIGPVRYAEVRYASPSRGDRSRAWNWWSDEQRGGGIWGAVGSHFVDAVRYLVGEIDSVQALVATIIGERPYGDEMRRVTSDDFAAVHLRMRNGALAVMTFSAVANGPDEPTLFTIHGENGAFRLTGEELLFAARGEAFRRIAGGEMAQRPGNSPGGAFGSATYHLGLALRRAIDEGDREALAPAATFDDGLEQQKVLDAARRARQIAWTDIH